MEEMYLKFQEVLQILYGPNIDQRLNEWPGEEAIRAAVDVIYNKKPLGGDSTEG
jgi:hypothetical protein